MFTGIIEELGKVMEIRPGAASARLRVAAPGIAGGVALGDSVAVNGVCLTAVQLGAGEFTADVMPETLRKTNLGELRAGDRVNLERALALGDRLGGHLVSGHVDGVGTLSGRRREDNAVVITIQTPGELLRYLAPRGSVAVDGISLTVVNVTRGDFSVSIIPHTATVTTLGKKDVGARVNLEMDLLARYVERLLEGRTEDRGQGGSETRDPGLTRARLEGWGF